MRSYTQRQAAEILGANLSALHSTISRGRRRGVLPPGVLEGGSVNDEFLRWYRAKRTTYTPSGEPLVTGLTPKSRAGDADELWARVIAHELRDREKTDLRYAQRVDLPGDKPVCLAILADAHFGNSHTRYSKAREDALTVARTDGMFAIHTGDAIDNWVTDHVQHVQREQPIPHREELALLDSWLTIMREKLVVVVAGNHEQRTYDLAGVDILQTFLKNAVVLYDAHEIRTLVTLGEASWRFLIRHQFPGKSINSASYGIEKFHAKDASWDVGIGAHEHGMTLVREFFDATADRKVKLAIMCGSYQYDSAYARELGLGRSYESGSIGLMLYPDGSIQHWRSLQAAAEYLAYLRSR